MKPADELLAKARFVTVCTPDHHGRLMGKRRPTTDWPELQRAGLAMPDFHLITGFNGRPLSGFAAAGVEHGFRNGRLKPDSATAFFSPLETETVHVLADALTAEGIVSPEAPRAILKRQIARLGANGFSARFASELEFYLYRHGYGEAYARSFEDLAPLYHRHGDNDVLVASIAAPFCDSLTASLAASGIMVDQIQGEGGAGQFEVNVAPAAPLAAADEHTVFKHTVKALAHAQGLAATFLAKPSEADAGSGGHIHISVAAEDGTNALGQRSLSPFGEQFVAGFLAYAPELTLLYAPYANSYKRLVPGAFTPLRVSWAWDSRTAMVRVIRGAGGPRIEFRLPGADVNPYHAYAALIAAGLRGVETKLALPPEKRGGEDGPECEAIPADLSEAVARFSDSRVARDALGQDVHTHLLQHARHELDVTRRAVTAWEVARGFEHA